jgi:hypothetical protein
MGDYVDGHAMAMFLFCLCFGTACDAITFAVAVGKTISRCLGRQYRAVLSLSFFDVYGQGILQGEVSLYH